MTIKLMDLMVRLRAGTMNVDAPEADCLPSADLSLCYNVHLSMMSDKHIFLEHILRITRDDSRHGIAAGLSQRTSTRRPQEFVGNHAGSLSSSCF